MSRYIDADALRKSEIERCRCVPCIGSNENNYKDLDEVLNEAPTADVVEVVRCKDCKHFLDEDEWDALGMCLCQKIATNDGGEIYPERNNFCSYGERREE